jgi:hypothetical protein
MLFVGTLMNYKNVAKIPMIHDKFLELNNSKVNRQTPGRLSVCGSGVSFRVFTGVPSVFTADRIGCNIHSFVTT